MYLLQDLKEEIHMDKQEVECPINGCRNKVQRQTSTFLRESQFLCKAHQFILLHF
jgi:hypothetical protein